MRSAKETERRRIALEIIKAVVGAGEYPPDLDFANIRRAILRSSLALADELIEATS